MNKLLFMGRKTYGAQALEWSVNNGWNVVAVVTDDHQETSPTAQVAKKYGLKLLDYEGLLEEISSKQLDFDLVVLILHKYFLKLQYL